MKVFLMLDDEPLDRRNLLIVGREKDAERLVECGHSYTYEEVNVANSQEVEEIYLDYMGIG